MDSDKEDLLPETAASLTPVPSVCSSTLSLTSSWADQPLSSRRGDLDLVRSSVPGLRTIKVNRRASNSEATPLMSIISKDMSVASLMEVILERCRLTGLDTSAYCLVARTTTRGQDVGGETTVLESSSLPLAEDRDKLKRSRFSIRQRGGRLVEIYDGRKWPVVRCGSVYITSTDTAHRVTQSVLCTPNVQEKKRKASKYTVAIGTSHGHVQAFLKENDTVLTVFEGCSAEEKCLLLIKKPKEASKKMLRSQTGHNLSMSDTHLYRQFDGTASNNPLTAHTMKNKPSKSQAPQPAMTSQIYTTEPRVRKAGNALPTRANELRGGGGGEAGRGRVANFVPIPELGIFTPEQHVLQNGTYAQHCHLREVNNNAGLTNANDTTKTTDHAKYDRGHQHSHSNGYPSSDSRFRSGQDHGGQSYARNQRTVVHSDHMTHSQAQPSVNSSFESNNKKEVYSNRPNRLPDGGQENHGSHNEAPPQHSQHPAVYHSCMDISALPSSSDRDYNSLNSNLGLKSKHLGPVSVSDLNSENDSVVSSSKDHDFNTIRSDQTYEHRYRPRLENEEKTRRKQEVHSSRVDSPSNMLDPANRSHSMGDLTSGLTFSLVGQKKPDSMLSVATCPSTGKLTGMSSKSDRNSAAVRHSYVEQGNGALKYDQHLYSSENSVMSARDTYNSNNSDTGDEVDGDYLSYQKGGSALQHIRDRLQKAVLTSQKKFRNNSQSSDGPGSKTRTAVSDQQRDAQSSQLNSANGDDGTQRSKNQDNKHYDGDSHFTSSHQVHLHQNYQPQQQVQQQQHHHQPAPRHRPVQTYQPPNSARYGRQYSAPESAQPPHTSSPKRRDSVETTSSFQSALSDSSHLIPPPLSSGTPYDNVKDNKADDHSTPRFVSNPANDGNKSPSKPRRSLPQVSLTETSERIKRFSEIMKSRISNHSSASNSRNGYSADGASSGSQCTPTRMSSVETTASGRSVSRKSSMDGVSDGEAGNGQALSARSSMETSHYDNLIPEQKGRYSQMVRELQQNHAIDKDKISHSTDLNHQSVSSSYDYQRRDDRKPQTQTVYNSRYESDVGKPGDRGKGHPHGHTHYTGHSHGLNPEDVPLPPGDRSSDSGQTTGTSNSYTGSVLDSGYTTNNDGESDHYHYHHHNAQHNHPQHHGNSHHTNAQQPLQHRDDPYRRQGHDQPPPYSHHEQHQAQHTEPRSSQPRPEKRRPPPSTSRHRTNLLNARQFGSVQNISTAQAHGNPKDVSNSIWQPHSNEPTSTFNSLPRSNGNAQWQGQNPSTNSVPYSAREYSSNENSQILNNVHKALIPSGVLAPVDSNRQPDGGPFQYRTATRRSWDFSDGHGFNRLENGISHQHRVETRYRSTDVISQRDNMNGHAWNKPPRQTDANFRAVNAAKENMQTSHSHHHPYPSHHHLSTDLSAHGYHAVPRADQQTGHPYRNANGPPESQAYNAKKSHSSENNPRGLEQQHANLQLSSDADNSNVKQRPVPVSRSNRNARGKTLPGGFRFNEADASGFGQAQSFNFELSLYHLTQKYELSPLCLDLPKHLTLKDMVNFKEVTVEVSLTESLGIPSSPQGQAPKIGSPGSAFTPVKNELQISGPPTILKVQVLSFTNIWKEIEKYCMLGLMLEADILVEVNGWFCLGADVAYLQRIVENCQGAITLTVARPKESDEKRYKGQTPAERVKSLESEISRLDTLIGLRDDKIKDLTAAATSAKSGKQILSNINGEVPCEGMVIGEDEYVV